MSTPLLIADIRMDGGTQARARLNEDIVQDYAEEMRAGAEFPPVVVFHDGNERWLADGFHRIAAAKMAGFLEFEAEVRPGTRRDAVLFAVCANGQHGLRRTNEDKRKAVMMLLEDDEWSMWSNSEIARRCGVSDEFVRKIRGASLPTVGSERTYMTRHGTVATMNTARIGHKPAVRDASDPDVNQDTPDSPAIDPGLWYPVKDGVVYLDGFEHPRLLKDDPRYRGERFYIYAGGTILANGAEGWQFADPLPQLEDSEQTVVPARTEDPESLAEKAARLSNSGPWTPGERQYLSAVKNFLSANQQRSADALARRFGALPALRAEDTATFSPAQSDPGDPIHLTAEAARLSTLLAARLGLSPALIIELALREKAEREQIEVG